MKKAPKVNFIDQLSGNTVYTYITVLRYTTHNNILFFSYKTTEQCTVQEDGIYTCHLERELGYKLFMFNSTEYDTSYVHQR